MNCVCLSTTFTSLHPHPLFVLMFYLQFLIFVFFFIISKDVPQLELKLGAPSLSLDSVQEGIDIYFDCHIDANPSPTTPITWLFNGKPLQPEPGKFHHEVFIFLPISYSDHPINTGSRFFFLLDF